MHLSYEPSQEAKDTAEFLMQTFVEAADDDVARAGQIARLYIEGMQHSNKPIVRETAACLSALAKEPAPKYLS